MLIYSPIPRWRDLFAALFMKTPTVKSVAQPWYKTGDEPFLFSRTCFSLQAIAEWYRSYFNKLTPIVWVPDYICNQSLQYLRHAGVHIVFYPVNSEYNPDWEAMVELAKNHHPDIFILVHYFGNVAESKSAKKFCKMHNAVLVEDAAHVLFPAAEIGESGDFVLYSPHKLLPIPHGAICIMRNKDEKAIAKMQSIVSTSFRKTAGVGFWIIKKIIQKLMLSLPIQRNNKFTDFDIDPAAVQQYAPLMNKLAKKLLFRMHNQLPSIANKFSEHVQLWQYLLQDKFDIQPVVHSNINTTPYLAIFRGKNHEAVKTIYQKLGRQQWPVQTWPDLPSEVMASPVKHKLAINLRNTQLTLPVVFSFANKKIAEFFLPELNTHEYSILWNGIERDEWESLFAKVNKSNILQSWGYGEAKTATGSWQIKRAIIYRKKQPVALIQALEKSWGPIKLLRINRGPIWLHEPTVEIHAVIYKLIKYQLNLCRGKLVFFAPAQSNHTLNRVWLNHLKYRVLPFPKWTSAWISLEHTEIQLRKNLNGKWRNQLKSAEEAGLECEYANEQVFPWLIERYKELQTDKKFTGLSTELIQAIYANCYRKNDFIILRALTKQIPVAAIVVIIHGTTATYLIGWNSEAGRDLCAHNFLLWNALLICKQRGCTWFDVGGIDVSKTPGIARFKQGLNGEMYHLIGEYLCL